MNFLELFSGLPLSIIQAQRIKEVDREIDLLKHEKLELEKEKTEILDRVIKLEQELSKLSATLDKFIVKIGVKFVRLPEGSFDKRIPYCPACEIALYIGSMCNRRTHMCSKCGFIAPFTERQLYAMLEQDVF